MQGHAGGCTVSDASTIAGCRRRRKALATHCSQTTRPQCPARTRHGPACARPWRRSSISSLIAGQGAHGCTSDLTSTAAILRTCKGSRMAVLTPSMQSAQPAPQLPRQAAARRRFGQDASKRLPLRGSRPTVTVGPAERCWQKPGLSPADISPGPARGGGALSAAAASAATR